MIGQTLGHHRILERIGEGAMGIVYKAHDTHLGRYVALKVLPSEKVADPGRKRRFVQEARAASALNHPNIITIYDIASDRGVDFIAMEYVEGRTLAQLIGPKPLPLTETLSYAVQIAGAMAAAHAEGIIHRDLKPANVMVARNGLVKVLDFGLAKLIEPLGGSEGSSTRTSELRTEAGAIVGTVAYMSPEQAEGRTIDARSDIFSFGALLYEMVTGRRAFHGESAIATLSAILHDEPRPPAGAVPPELVHAISRCLRKKPEDRFQSSSELKLVLEKIRLDSAERETLPTIAVLPFANLSADKENEYFSDGLAEEIINALTKVPGLRVTARTSSFAFRGKDVEISEIGARLKVDHILEGSVRKSGNRIRVSAQLVKVSDSYHLWSERYDREMTDVFTIQDDISQAIVEKLRVHLMGDRQLVKRPTRNLEAYNFYLKGRYHKDKVTREGLVTGQLFFDRAIEADPDYALAYYGLAEALWHSGYYSFRAPQDVLPKCKSATLRALELDDELAEAHAMLGMILGNYEYEWKAAEQEFKRALNLDPASGVCHDRYGFYFLRPMLRLDEAVAEVQRALEMDPLSLFINGHLAYLFHTRREYDRALAQYRSTLELDPNYPLAHWLSSISYYVCGMVDAGVAEVETLARLAGRVPLAVGGLGAGYAAAGRRDEALAMIAELDEAGRKVYVSPACKAWIAVSMGDLDGAFECLGKAVEQHEPMTVNLNSEPFYDKLRSDPRYHALLRKMNLPP